MEKLEVLEAGSSDYLRDEALAALMLLTRANGELQRIAYFSEASEFSLALAFASASRRCA